MPRPLKDESGVGALLAIGLVFILIAAFIVLLVYGGIAILELILYRD